MMVNLRRSLSVLILWTILSVNTYHIENNTEDFLLRAYCELISSDKLGAEDCLSGPRYKVIEEATAANIKLLCQDVGSVVLVHDNGTFVVEQRAGSGNWTGAKIISNDETELDELAEGIEYQFRFHRITANGIFRPDVTKPIKIWLDSHVPGNVPRIGPAGDITVVEPARKNLAITIEFEPVEDLCCRYRLSVFTDHRSYIHHLIKVRDYRHYIGNLDYGNNYTFSILAQTSFREISENSTQFEFETPTCLEMNPGDLTICPPLRLEGIVSKVRAKGKGIYDVNVSWDRPNLPPDNYTVELYELYGPPEDRERRHVPGNLTEVDFLNRSIENEYEIVAYARSLGGQSEISRSLRSIQRENTNPSKKVKSDYTTPIISVASVFVILGSSVVAYCKYKKRKEVTSEGQDNAFNGKNTVSTEAKDIPRFNGGVTESLLKTIDEWEIDPDRLQVKDILGTGAFGIVRLGTLRDKLNQETTVACKMLKDDPSQDDERDFELEITMMKSVGQHQNIVSLVGCCTMGTKRLLVVEFCCFGDLETCLRKKWKAPSRFPSTEAAAEKVDDISYSNLFEIRSTSDRIERFGDTRDINISNAVANQCYGADSNDSSETLTTIDMLNFGRQIATGMDFLASNRVVHRDLAARNVLVCENRRVKISDFGLSRDIYKDNVYKRTGTGPLPSKWMAIESLTYRIYTTASDVWSFGILLWEIVTLGGVPYPDLSGNEVFERLPTGYRLEKPKNCSNELYEMMRSCWATNPDERPKFTDLQRRLDELIGIESKNTYLELSLYENEKSPIITPKDDDNSIEIISNTNINHRRPKYANNDVASILRGNFHAT